MAKLAPLSRDGWDDTSTVDACFSRQMIKKKLKLIMQRFDITVTVRMAKPQVHNSG